MRTRIRKRKGRMDEGIRVLRRKKVEREPILLYMREREREREKEGKEEYSLCI